MRTGASPTRMVGNEFVAPRPRLQMAAATPQLAAKPVIAIPVVPQLNQYSEDIPVRRDVAKRSQPIDALKSALEFIHTYSIGTFALLFLLVGSSGVQVAANYKSAQIAASVPQNFHVIRSQPHSGFNMAVPSDKLANSLAAITGQSATIAIGSQSQTLSADTIKSWLQIVSDDQTGTSYIHVNQHAITATLQAAAQKYSKSAVNEVTSDSSGATSVIAAGRNGLQVSVPDGLDKTIAKSLLSGQGIQAPLNAAPLAFQSVTPAAFPKLIEVNVTSKHMWLYQNGQLYKDYDISAGKPSTPTPIGQFKIFEKLASQDMKGTNPNGTPYFQPHVHWINYFLPGGFAVHGVYWHPLSWFGANNSSHGCVGLPDDQAKEVYDWAPLGTTVITHA